MKTFDLNTANYEEVEQEMIRTAKTGDRVYIDGDTFTIEIQGNTVWVLDQYRDEQFSYER